MPAFSSIAAIIGGLASAGAAAATASQANKQAKDMATINRVKDENVVDFADELSQARPNLTLSRRPIQFPQQPINRGF